jgi:hypothetical protein
MIRQDLQDKKSEMELALFLSCHCDDLRERGEWPILRLGYNLAYNTRSLPRFAPRNDVL